MQAFDNNPFFMVTVETEKSNQEQFRKWYEKEYLPKTMADIPMWYACRRYESEERKPKHFHTVYEAKNIFDLERGFELLRAPYRFRSNADWNSWVGRGITNQHAASFQPIFLLSE